jgi:hypothetical protein
MNITAEQFEQAAGHPPIQDDLERANCTRAGEIGHFYCGWCHVHNHPKAECGDCFEATARQSKGGE